MRNKWILRQNLSDLRMKQNLSMDALAQLAFTTNTTIFRIEKSGYITDFSLAEQIASVFGIPVSELCEFADGAARTEKQWQEQLDHPYQTEADPDCWYYLAFVRRYDKDGEYSVMSPTVWVSMDAGKEIRMLPRFGSDGIVEHLAERGMKCAVVHDEIDLIFFYYGIPNNEERAALVRSDIAETVYPHMVQKYRCDMNSLPNHYGFKDLVQVELRGGNAET